MAGLNHIREAYEQVYSQLDERMDPEERALRRAEVADKKASRMPAKAAAKYADSEAKSASREDKKSKGKHIHGMADSYDVDGDLVDEELTGPRKERAQELIKSKQTASGKAKPGQKKSIALTRRVASGGEYEGLHTTYKGGISPTSGKTSKGAKNIPLHGSGNKSKRRRGIDVPDTRHEEYMSETQDSSYLETDMKKRQKNNEKAVEAMKKTKAYADMVKAARKHFEEFVAEEDPCWKGYTQVGMKKKGGKEVPNCVPSKGVPKAKGYKKEDFGLEERKLDPTETKEKERLVKGLKKSAADFKARYGKRAKSVMYATATKMAKDHMDTSKSDRRYSAER